MQRLSNQIEKLEDQVNHLIQKLEYLKKENLMLIEENVKLKKELENLMEVHSDREDNGSKVSVGSEQLKEELDHYIHEIDKCIEWINTM